MEKSKILLLEGVSGSGKSTLGEYLQTLGVSELISCTTRQPRKGEIPNKTYYYITKELFDNIDKLENTCYSGNYYCLSRQEVERHNEELVYCIVDEQGVKQIRENYGEENVIVIYVHVTMNQMKERLKARGDSEDEIKKRIDYAITNDEMNKDRELADFTIYNDNLEKSKEILKYIVKGILSEEEIIF